MFSAKRAVCLWPRQLVCRRQHSLLRPAAQILGCQWYDGRVCGPWSGPFSLHSRDLHSSFSLWGKIVPFNLPDVGEGIMTVQVMEWLVKPGDRVSLGSPVCEVQSDKAAVMVLVPYDGVVKELSIEEGQTATMGKPLLMVELDEGEEEAQPSDAGKESEDSSSVTEQEPPSSSVIEQESSSSLAADRVLAAPAVRKMAKEHGINLADVRGSGKDGRVLKEDMQRHIEMKKAPMAPPIPPPPPLTPTPAPTILTQDRSEPVKGFKAVMVRTMTTSGQIPQFGYCDEIDMTRLVELRQHLKDQMLERGIRFSYMPVIVKAVSMALHHYPILNSHVNPECTTITYKADHNIGVAMDTPEGLIVPNIKQVQFKSVFDVAVEMNRIHDLGLKGRLTPSDVVGGTFSLSNIGAFGGTYTKPLLLPPEVAIGAFGKVQVLPRFDEEGCVRKAHVMHVSWSADHRTIDGATVARFSNLWKSYLENPATMIVDLK